MQSGAAFGLSGLSKKNFERLYAPQFDARRRDTVSIGKPFIADSVTWGLHQKARAEEDRARASCAAIVLLLDEVQQRLRFALRPKSKPTKFSFGPIVGQTTLALSLFAAGNSIRHADEWSLLPWTPTGHDTTSNSRAAISIAILNDALGYPVRFGGHVCREVLMAFGLPSSGKEAADRLISDMRELAREVSVQWLGSDEPLTEAEDEIGAEETYTKADFQFVH